MARIRNIKPSFYLNDEIAALPAMTRLAFPGLWCIADRAGRLEDRPARIKAQVFPYDEIDMEKILAQLAEAKFILRYEVDGNRYIQVLNFEKHQSPHMKEAASTIPAPGSHGGGGKPPSGAGSDEHRKSTVLAPDLHQKSRPDLGNGSGKGREGDHAHAHGGTSPLPSTPSGKTTNDAPSSKKITQQGEGPTAPDREKAAAALRTSADYHQRHLAAGKQAAGWQFTEADLALLSQAAEAIGEVGEDLPGAVGRRLAKGSGPAYDRWFSLSASEAAAWIADSVTAALRTHNGRLDYVIGIIKSRLDANRTRPGLDAPGGGITNISAAPSKKAEPYADKPWGQWWNVVTGLPDAVRFKELVRDQAEAGVAVDVDAAHAAFAAGGVEAGMDLLWAAVRKRQAV